MKKLLRISALLILLLLTLFFTFNASPSMSRQDEVYIKAFIHDWKMADVCDSCHRNFQTEINFISTIQDSVVGNIRHEQVSFSKAGDVKFYYENRKGFCFDRALLLELFYKYYGFKVRHAFIYYHTDSTATGNLDFLDPKIYSHAMLEIKTVRGWMAVGTNHCWLGIDKDGKLLDLEKIRAELKATGTLALAKNSEEGQPFFTSLPLHSNFKFIYGLYSRHGKFLQSVPVEKWMKAAGLRTHIPDYNIRSLMYNF